MQTISKRIISRFVWIGLLFSVFFVLPTTGKTKYIVNELNLAQKEFDNGNFSNAIKLAENALEISKKTQKANLAFELMDLIAVSQINLGKYSEAEGILNNSLIEVSRKDEIPFQKGKIYQRLAMLKRAQKNYPASLDYSKKAIAIAPDNPELKADYFLNLGRIMFSSGFDISAIIWLEKGEKIIEKHENDSTKLDIYRFLSLAWSSKLNYREALKYAEKQVIAAEKTKYKFKHRQALLDWATVLSATGQKQKSSLYFEKGLRLSISENNAEQAGKFLTSLLLNSLYDNNVTKATNYLRQLESADLSDKFKFEILLGKAIISDLSGQRDNSAKFFAELDKIDESSGFIIRYWKITLAEKNKDWNQVIKLNQEVLKITLEQNFREDLLDIYFTFAKAYFNLNQIEKSSEYLENSLAIIEEIRASENTNLTLGILETYHNAYRLLTQIKFGNPQESFELADFLKARFLKDRINNSLFKIESTISLQTRQLLEELSIKYIDDESIAAEIEKNEKFITTKIPELNLKKPDLSELEKITSLNDTAVISYFFTLDKKLIAFIWEKGKELRKVELDVSETEIETIAAKTQRDIKNRVFFKRDGKTIYDKLVKPLALTSKHIIFVPDKSLWKIPFQALSSDGEKYLIEENLISYAPSVSILLEQLKVAKPNRQTLQAFANSSFETKLLQYVNSEASTVAEIYNTKPIINATAGDFSRVSEKFDILHFSMHAEVASDHPLDSFLGFRKIGSDDGRLTVEELLNIKLKKGSMVFLASCDTNNVLSGEGLVSLAWAMTGSGATTVISAQWEANDKSTAIFTKTFYRHYKQGSSSAEALQKASLELIKNKSGNIHEPYYWADFTLNGDFR